MTEQDLKYQDLKREYEALKEENQRLRFSNSLLEKELKEQKDHLGDVNEMVVTNADRIRAYSDEDLARFINGAICNSNGWCDDCSSMRGEWCYGINENINERLLKWLKEKVE